MERDQQINHNDEIDLMVLLQKIWKSRKKIAISVAVFFVFGLLIAIFSAKEYSATTIMVPQSSDGKSGGGSLGGLAAMAGINLSGTPTEAIPVSVYPNIVKSIPFKKKMVQTPLNFEQLEKPITYEEYYKEYVKPNWIAKIKGFIFGLFSPKEEEEKTFESHTDKEIISLNKQDRDILNSIDSQLSLQINEKEGIITLSYAMPEPLVAAQMLQNAQKLLQEAITEFKIQKATEEFNFIEQRYQEAEKDFKEKQFALAQFQDHNRNLFGSLPQTRLQQLQTDYNLSFGVYSELAKQLEAKRIKVKEDQPVFTIIEPVSIPNERSKPKRIMIIAIWTFLGVVIGIGAVFVKDFVRQFKDKKTEEIQ